MAELDKVLHSFERYDFYITITLVGSKKSSPCGCKAWRFTLNSSELSK